MNIVDVVPPLGVHPRGVNSMARPFVPGAWNPDDEGELQMCLRGNGLPSSLGINRKSAMIELL
jgi:hypothetical protein